MRRPSPEELLAETASLAYHLHWPLDTILDLEHADRRRFLAAADELIGAHAHPAAFQPESDAMVGELADLGLFEES